MSCGIMKCLLFALLIAPSVQQLSGEKEEAQDDRSERTAVEILASLYNAAQGKDWDDDDHWLNSNNVCKWKGITCYDEDESDQRRVGHVKKIDLKDNHLVGTMPTILYTLPYLSSLTLKNNPDLSVSFDNIDKAQYLKYVSFSGARIDSFAGISGAASLESLHITNSHITGTLPAEIFQVTTLQGIFANQNSFSGSISSSIGLMTDLEQLFFYQNDLQGQLPTEIGLLTNLKILALAANSLTGTIPTQLNDCEALEILALQREVGELKGGGLSGTLPSLGNLAKLSEFYAENQLLTGTIPSDFLASAPKGELIKVDLAANQLTGTVPATLKEFERLRIGFEDNQIEAIGDGLCGNIDGWFGGAVGDFGCNAFICPPGTTAPRGRQTITDACKTCDVATYYGTTICLGDGGSSPTDERAILELFYYDMDGGNWKDDDGWLEEDSSFCTWTGISCNDAGNVTKILLKGNSLVGTFPAAVFSLPQLKTLTLDSNSVDFPFTGISKASNLEHLYLTSIKISKLVGLEELSKTGLTEMKLSSNGLTGSIPSALFAATSLTKLTLSHNFFTGSIPSEIGTMTALKQLHGYGNALVGSLPSQLGSLVALTDLDLSENSFTGTLPTTLEKLTNLHTLSLHQTSTPNGMDGPLLPFIGMTKLTSLRLEGNQLGGNLPTNLLLNTGKGDSRIEVSLADNQFGGVVPAEWASRFDDLLVDLTGNRIVGIPGDVCDMEDWMDGKVGRYECDAVLCPAGTYNEFGRRTDADSKCVPCTGGGNLLGARECNNGAPSTGELSILKEFYYAAGGSGWKDVEGWLTAADYCNEWDGITCDVSKRVMRIHLTDSGLSGSIATSIYKLSSLEELHIQGNDVSLSFDGIEQATRLHTLDAASINIKSMKGVGKASSLMVLMLNDNDLSGSLPDELFQLTKLKSLSLSYNSLTGRIPKDIDRLSNLVELLLRSNKFSGQIPAAIVSLTGLVSLSLSDNLLSGSLPEELGDLTSLELLALEKEQGSGAQQTEDLSNTAQVGVGIRGPLPSFSKLTNLRSLYLGANSLSGTIPFDFLDGVTDKSVKINIDLAKNHLKGTVPASLTQFDKLDILLSGNMLTGIAPGLCLKDDWMDGLVDEYGCDAILCPLGTYNSFGRKGLDIGVDQANNVISCDPCVSGVSGSYMGSMDCLQNEEADSFNERTILHDLFNATDGFNWKVNTNWMDDDLSICSWFGISCLSDGEESVTIIQLPYNDLAGEIPSSIFGLKNLKEINFSVNDVKVHFNHAAAPTGLEYVNLDQTKLTSLKGLDTAAPDLTILHMSHNGMDHIPTQINSLSSLSVLYMSSNSFDSTFPTSLLSLTDLTTIACDSCELKGTIPDNIGSLTNLGFFSLFSNHMSGTLPTQLMLLSNLRHFDVGYQAFQGNGGFSGTLPDFSGLVGLSALMLSWNSFTGSIPTTFLSDLQFSGKITVDLRSNQLTGAIPSEMGRFTNMAFLASGNKISAVPQVVCSQPWNDKEGELTGCNHVLCEKGFFNLIGYETSHEACVACTESPSEFYGSTSCGTNVEREILVDLYKALNGDKWKMNGAWMTDGSICNWHGIACFLDAPKVGNIKEISLMDNNLVGTLPASIYDLEFLELLELKRNDIEVSFKGIEKARNLRLLYLSETNILSMDGISNATSLEQLHLTSCNITGTLPPGIFELTKLQRLFLNYNQFEGTLPSAVSKLSALSEFYLFDNLIEGTIPSQLGALSQVTLLALGDNKMTGVIPSSLSRLSKLEILSLQRQTGWSLSGGTGLIGPVPTFDGSVSLKEVYLGQNSLVGTIPNSFLSGITNLTRKVMVDATNNQLEGRIPSALSKFQDLRIFVAGNRIDAIPDEVCAKAAWMDGLMETGCDALLCPPGTYNEFGRRISDQQLCEPCTFNSSSFFYGSMTCEAQEGDDLDERSILFQLYRALDGNNWLQRDNWLEDNRSICTWHGVNCIDEKVVKIELASNGLKGTIPGAIYHLSSLKELNVRDNEVELSFHAADVSETLETLYLEKTKVTTLNGIGQLSPLKVLEVQDSQLGGGTIPKDLYGLSNLEIVDLSNTGLGGTLAEDIGKLTSLKQLFLQVNDIEGTLPSALGQLTNLEVLDLSENAILGLLPTEMERMTSLKSVFMDSLTHERVGLSGPMLAFSNMPNLREVFISSNSLTGSLPSNFLAGIESVSAVINVGLGSNSLTGSIPTGLSKFNRLNIVVTDNMIDSIDDSLCSKSGWMGGAVDLYGCAAILCPTSTYNLDGRQSNDENECVTCSGEDESFLGSTTCAVLQKKQEREALELFFQATRGQEWKENRGWMDDEVDICEWHGITCKANLTVESIVLGSNNLKGRPPPEIFDLEHLAFLWLYSNPIDFSFVGIEKARRLTSLLLDSTGLKSIRGIGQAPALRDVDVRFNALTGTLPSELSDLRQLNSFAAANNLLTGTIPPFANVRNLKALRLGGNALTGTMPDFSTHKDLFSIDLSDNRLSGTIPTTLLSMVPITLKSFVDLSSNRLTGTIPGILARRFNDLTLYLRDNMIEGIDQDMCLASDFNGGDVGEYSCNGLLCPAGTYAPLKGRASKDGGCQSCKANQYFGASICSDASTVFATGAWIIASSISVLLAVTFI